MKFRTLLMPILLALFATTLVGQDLRCLSADDQRQIRQMLADREFYKNSYEESERQRAATAQSRDNWKTLYEAEKLRADQVQEDRLKEKDKEIGDLRKALTTAETQMKADADQIGKLNARIDSLKGQRKWWFAGGAVLGGVGGYFGGKAVSDAGGVTNIINGNGAQSRMFRASFSF